MTSWHIKYQFWFAYKNENCDLSKKSLHFHLGDMIITMRGVVHFYFFLKIFLILNFNLGMKIFGVGWEPDGENLGSILPKACCGLNECSDETLTRNVINTQVSSLAFKCQRPFLSNKSNRCESGTRNKIKWQKYPQVTHFSLKEKENCICDPLTYTI